MDALKAVKKARLTLGLGPAVLDYLERLVSMTMAEDWEEGGTPVAFGQVRAIAMELDVEERTINNYERCLVERGLVLWHDYGNCRRFGRRDETGKLVEAYGIVLTPLIERFAEIEKMGEGDALDLKLRRAEIGRIKALRRTLKYLVNQAHARIPGTDVIAAAEIVIGKIPERTFGKKTWPAISVLALRFEIEDVTERLKREISSVSAQKISDKADENFRHQYTEDTWKNPVNISNWAAPKRTSPAGDEIILQTEPANAGGMEEVSGRRTSDHDSPPGGEDGPDADSSGSGGSTGIEHIRFDQVTDVASELMRELIAEEAGQGRENWSALDRAAATAAAWIGVSPSLWATMRAQIGPAAAAVSIVLVERRMTDPDSPVSQPGGYLRGMLAKAGRGQLHLHKSIFGLSKSATSRRDPAPRRREADWLPARQIHQVGASPRNPSRRP
jgi:replication initiation protein RepC